ncbi:MAG: hypothetical protein NTU41_09745 [Chloroflexi bacterium]|nr:hypothetical protein [Chloroflexota bacterium]
MSRPRHPALLQHSYDHFLLVKEVDGCSPRTIEWLGRGLQNLEAFSKGSGFPSNLMQLREEHILSWLKTSVTVP